MNFLGQGFQKLEHYRQTDGQAGGQADATEHIASMIIKWRELSECVLVGVIAEWCTSIYRCRS